MKERPILFSGGMVRAILAGRKTQTRRIIKLDNGLFISREYRAVLDPENSTEREVMECASPYGQPGGRLWVRETWTTAQNLDPDSIERSKIFYRADIPHVDYIWKPSIHMPRWASRLTLEITNVKVERLNSISVEDALAEGISHSTMNDPKVEYQWLWEKINGHGSWEKNSWVWVIEFKDVS